MRGRNTIRAGWLVTQSVKVWLGTAERQSAMTLCNDYQTDPSCVGRIDGTIRFS